jgi:hypothetical protein
MVPRGEISVVFAGLGMHVSVEDELRSSVSLFSAVALMGLWTTLITPSGLGRPVTQLSRSKTSSSALLFYPMDFRMVKFADVLAYENLRRASRSSQERIMKPDFSIAPRPPIVNPFPAAIQLSTCHGRGVLAREDEGINRAKAYGGGVRIRTNRKRDVYRHRARGTPLQVFRMQVIAIADDLESLVAHGLLNIPPSSRPLHLCGCSCASPGTRIGACADKPRYEHILYRA